MNLLIESEKSQAKPGWEDRVNSLKRTRDEAVEINRLGKPGFDPWEKYRENEETRQFFQKQTEEAQEGFVRRAWKTTKQKAGQVKKYIKSGLEQLKQTEEAQEGLAGDDSKITKN